MSNMVLSLPKRDGNKGLEEGGLEAYGVVLSLPKRDGNSISAR